MKLDKWLALIILIGAVAYGLAAFNYPLLPFERNLPFLPNTLPKGLSILASLVAMTILLSPGDSDSEQSVMTLEQARSFEIGKAIGLVSAMVLYALLLKPVGFIAATSTFVIGSAVLLGERKFKVLVPVAAFAAFSIWYLVQETLGIFLRPWPAFLS